MAIIDKIQLSGTVYTIGNETTTAVTSASTDNEIPTAKAVYDAIPTGGTGGSYTAGRGIDITNDIISFNLPISGDVITLGISEGSGTTATYCSHAEGENTTASGSVSHAEGYYTVASDAFSHAEGNQTIANGGASHAEGYGTQTNGDYSHAEGFHTTASGSASHAEGYYTIVSGNWSHAEGHGTVASGSYSHSEGYHTTASGNSSHAEGRETIANNESEHASGRWNISSSASTTLGDSGNTLFSVGNGTGNNARHNAFEIRQNGDIYIANTNDTSTPVYSEKPMIKLQDYLGGGGIDTGTVQTMIDESISGKVDTSAITTSVTSASTDNEIPTAKAVYDAIPQGGGVNVVQTTGTSTADVMSQDAVTTQLNGKGDAIGFDMVGRPQKKVTFQMKRGGVNGTTISSRDLTLGRGLVYGEEGFDTLSTSGLVEASAITTSVTSSSTDVQVPSAKAVNDKLGGLSIVKLTQSEYDALTTKDSSTIYFIVG